MFRNARLPSPGTEAFEYFIAKSLVAINRRGYRQPSAAHKHRLHTRGDMAAADNHREHVSVRSRPLSKSSWLWEPGVPRPQ